GRVAAEQRRGGEAVLRGGRVRAGAVERGDRADGEGRAGLRGDRGDGRRGQAGGRGIAGGQRGGAREQGEGPRPGTGAGEGGRQERNRRLPRQSSNRLIS